MLLLFLSYCLQESIHYFLRTKTIAKPKTKNQNQKTKNQNLKTKN